MTRRLDMSAGRYYSTATKGDVMTLAPRAMSLPHVPEWGHCCFSPASTCCTAYPLTPVRLHGAVELGSLIVELVE